MTVGAMMLAALCSYTGWGFVALTQPTHAERLSLPIACRRRHAVLMMRIAAGLLTWASAALCIMQDGWSFGVLMWVFITCVAAVLVTLTLTCLQARLRARPHSRG